MIGNGLKSHSIIGQKSSRRKVKIELELISSQVLTVRPEQALLSSVDLICRLGVIVSRDMSLTLLFLESDCLYCRQWTGH